MKYINFTKDDCHYLKVIWPDNKDMEYGPFADKEAVGIFKEGFITGLDCY